MLHLLRGLVIPVFKHVHRALDQRRKPAGHALDARLVAAIRWDYEHGAMSKCAVARKYRLVVGRNNVLGIVNGRVRPEVVAKQDDLAWSKRTWNSDPSSGRNIVRGGKQ
jgi:hypothetical protein